MTWVGTAWRRLVGAPQANTLTTSRQLEAVLLEQYRPLALAGVAVTPETALMVQAVGAAVSILAESAAQLPLILYREMAGGVRRRAKDHPLWGVLHDKPNTFQDAFQFRETLTLHLTLWGNAYAFINRVDGGRRVAELLPIHPDRVRPEQDENYRVTYRVVLPGGEEVTIPADRMLHIRDRSVDGFRGISRLKTGRDSIGLALAAERWGAQLFGNGARPSGVLSTEMRINEEHVKRIQESWKAAHGGENALGTAVLDGGWKWTPLVMNNKDAQFIETRKFQLDEVARLYRIPPHMLANLERATFANIEHQALEFVKYALMPWLRRWEMAINTQVIGGGDVYAEFLVDALLRADTKTRFEAYALAIQNKIMNPNEVRERENLEPYEGGDDFTGAANIFGDRRNEPAAPS